LYLDDNDLPKSRAVFERLIARFPRSYAGHFFLGKIDFQEGDLDQAEKRFLKTLEIAPEIEEAQLELAKLYIAKSNNKSALKYLEGILAKNAKSYRAAFYLAALRQALGQEKDADNILTPLGRESKKNSAILRTFQREYLDAKSYAVAISLLSGMLKGDPESSELHLFLASAYAGAKNSDDAIAHFAKVKKEHRYYVHAKIREAYLVKAKAGIKKATITLEKALELKPTDTELMLHLGLHYEEQSQFEKAVAIFKRGIAADSKDTKLHYRLGVVYDKWGRKEDSISQMKRVIELDAEDVRALNYLGYTYAESGRNLDEAEKLIKRALKNQPNDGAIIDSLGWVYFQKGLFEKAVKYLEKAVGLVGNDPVVLEHMGDAYQKTKAPKKALEFYRRAIEKKKDKDKSQLEKKIKKLLDASK